MPLCQIDNVDVVADPRSVRGIVLIAVNAQIRELPKQGAGDVGGKVIGGLLPAVLADEPGGMRADGVEVAQRGKAEVVALPREIMQEQLVEILAEPIRAADLADNIALAVRHGLGRAVHRGGGGEHQLVHLMRFHCVEQVEGGRQVGVEISSGVFNGLRDGF